MKSFFAKWFFSKAIDEDKPSAKFAKDHFEESQSFRKWAKDIAAVDEQLKAGVNEANHKPSAKLHQRTMDALHDNAFTKNDITRNYFLSPRPFAAFAFCAVLIISTIVAINMTNNRPANNRGEWQVSILKPAQLQEQSRSFMDSYLSQPLIREGEALYKETQRAGERLWQRFPLNPRIIPASYTREED